MKIYKCDACGKDFNPHQGMVSGTFEGDKEVSWREQIPPENPMVDITTTVRDVKLVVRKTLKLFRKDPVSKNHKKESKDLCPKCMGLLETA